MLSSSMDAPLTWGLARKCRQISGGQSICANLVCGKSRTGGILKDLEALSWLWKIL